jgi:pre-mRNA-splicing factor SYF1
MLLGAAEGAPDAGADAMEPEGEAVVYEEELLQNPYSMKLWIRYLQIKAEAPFGQRKLLFERALKALPGSYKLWCALAGCL